MKRKLMALVVGGLLILATVETALATPHAPTNAGNGAGESGQCAGNPWDRPHGCKNFK